MEQQKNGGQGKPKIKICGLSRPCDIDFVNEARPDYCGFILGVPKSRRNISIPTLYSLRARLAPGIIPVGVFVNAPPEAILPLARDGILGAIQLHGAETPDDIRRLKEETSVPIIKAFRIPEETEAAPSLSSPEKGPAAIPMPGQAGTRGRAGFHKGRHTIPESVLSVLREAVKSPADLILLDNGNGGTGKRFNWSYAAAMPRPYLLAGGLGPENAEKAISLLHPWGLDMSSGVETDGLKDRDKILAAVAAVRAAAKST